MPTNIGLEELKAVNRDVIEFKGSNERASSDLIALIKKHRAVGYKNLCRLILGESPERLRGEQ